MFQLLCQHPPTTLQQQVVRNKSAIKEGEDSYGLRLEKDKDTKRQRDRDREQEIETERKGQTERDTLPAKSLLA